MGERRTSGGEEAVGIVGYWILDIGYLVFDIEYLRPTDSETHHLSRGVLNIK